MNSGAETVKSAHEQAWMDFDQNSAQEAAERKSKGPTAPRDRTSKPKPRKKSRDGNARSSEEAVLQTAEAKVRKAQNDLKKAVVEAKEEIAALGGEGRLRAAEKGIGELYKFRGDLEELAADIALKVSALRESTADAMQSFDERLSEDDGGVKEALTFVQKGLETASDTLDKIFEKQESIDARTTSVEGLLRDFPNLEKLQRAVETNAGAISGTSMALSTLENKTLPKLLDDLEERLQEYLDDQVKGVLQRVKTGNESFDDAYKERLGLSEERINDCYKSIFGDPKTPRARRRLF